RWRWRRCSQPRPRARHRTRTGGCRGRRPAGRICRASGRTRRWSALDWTIVRAAILNDQPASGDCTAGNTGTVGRIGRADLADFLVGQVKDDAWRKQAVSVTNRPGSRACR
ncbi:MAG: NAD(P)H-binding protein, partial [Acidobacteria bacterium]|nr:NAD(P)H-binding protein [Acidobacteriota bacterium]